MTTGRCCRALRAATFAATCVVLAATAHILMSGSPIARSGLVAAFVVTGTAAWALAGRERGTVTVTAATVTVQAGLHAAFSLSQSLTAPRQPGVSVFRTWVDHLLCRMPSMPSSPSTTSVAISPSATATATVTAGATATATAGGPAPGHRHRVAEAMTYPEHATHHVMPGSHATAHATAHSTPHGTPHTGRAAVGMMPDGHGTASEAMSAVHDMTGTAPLFMLAAHLLAALLCGLWLAYGERVAFRALRAVAGWLSEPLRLALGLVPPPDGPSSRPHSRHTATVPCRLLLASSRETRGPPVGIAVV